MSKGFRPGKYFGEAQVAREYANSGWSVKIADLDVSQGTSFNWQGRRLQTSYGQKSQTL